MKVEREVFDFSILAKVGNLRQLFHQIIAPWLSFVHASEMK